MEVKAYAKYLRISPQKARLITQHFKGKNAQKALEELKLIPQKAAYLLAKLIKSALANAENNFNLKKEDLIISQLVVEEGPSYKRIKPRARGGRDVIKKRTSHIRVVLVPQEAVSKKEIRKEEKPKIQKAEIETKAEKKEIKKKEAKRAKKEIKVKKPIKKEITKEEKEVKEEVKEKPTIKEEKKPLKERRPFFQRFFRRKGGM